MMGHAPLHPSYGLLLLPCQLTAPPHQLKSIHLSATQGRAPYGPLLFTGETTMKRQKRFPRWPALRQLISGDAAGLGASAFSERTRTLHPRIKEADRVVGSICP